MATAIPYTGVPTSTPTFEPTPAVHIEATPAAFGTNIARSVEHLGEVQEGAGKELFDRAFAFQDLTNHATAREASVRTMQEQAKLWSDFDSKGGMDAGPEALNQLQKNLDDVRQRNGQGLNPMASELYQNDAASAQRWLLMHSAGHSAQAMRAYNLDTIQAQKDTVDNLVQGTPHDKAAVERAYSGNVAKVTLIGHNRGYTLDSPIGQDALLKANSQTSLKAITGFIDRGDPEGAKDFFETAKTKGRIVGEWADKAQELIERGQITHGSHDIANRTFDPKKSEGENIEAASKAADKASDGDSRVIDATVAQTRTKFATAQAIQNNNLNRAKSTIDRAIVGMAGKAPQTLDALKQDPEFHDAFATIESNEEHAGQTLIDINNRITSAIKNDNELTNERTLVTQRLIGEAHEQPQEFLKEDLWKTNLTMDQRKELIRLQDGIRSSGNNLAFRDRATEQVMGDMRKALEHAGLARGTTEYNEFRGALQQEFDFMREGGKIVDPKTAGELATKLLQDKVLAPGIIFNTWGLSYQPSTAEAATIRQQLGASLTDDQVQRVYLRKLYDVLYGTDKPNARPNQ